MADQQLRILKHRGGDSVHAHRGGEGSGMSNIDDDLPSSRPTQSVQDTRDAPSEGTASPIMVSSFA